MAMPGPTGPDAVPPEGSRGDGITLPPGGRQEAALPPPAPPGDPVPVRCPLSGARPAARLTARNCRSPLLERRAEFSHQLGRDDSDDLARALDLVPASLSPTARTRILLTSACHSGRKRQEDGPMIEEALALARRAGDPGDEAHALLQLAVNHADPGGMALPGSPAMQMVAQARSIAATVNRCNSLVHVAINESHLLEGAGEHEAAAEVARRGIADAGDRGLLRTWGTFLAINLAEPLMALGRWDEAMEVLERARELSPPPLHQASLDTAAGLIAVARGDTAAAAQSAAARAVLEAARFIDQHHLPLGVLEIEAAIAAGDPATAMAVAATAVARFDLPGAITRYGWPVLVSGARACVTALRQAAARGDAASRETATALLAELRRIAADYGTSGPVQQAWRRTFGAVARQAEHIAAARPGGPAGVSAGWDGVGGCLGGRPAAVPGGGSADGRGRGSGGGRRLRRGGHPAAARRYARGRAVRGSAQQRDHQAVAPGDAHHERRSRRRRPRRPGRRGGGTGGPGRCRADAEPDRARAGGAGAGRGRAE